MSNKTPKRTKAQEKEYQAFYRMIKSTKLHYLAPELLLIAKIKCSDCFHENTMCAPVGTVGYQCLNCECFNTDFEWSNESPNIISREYVVDGYHVEYDSIEEMLSDGCIWLDITCSVCEYTWAQDQFIGHKSIICPSCFLVDDKFLWDLDAILKYQNVKINNVNGKPDVTN
jgi:hypothetical protein